VRKYLLPVLLVLVVGALALVAAGCGGDGDDGGGGGGSVSALPASSCGPLQYKGEGDPDYLIASDLPLQGSSRTQTTQMNQAIAYELEQRDWKAGDYNIGFQACDDASAQLAKWDPSKCSANANAYKGNDKLLGVLGTFNSGCAAIEIPVLNQAPEGGILLFSAANTYGCLTEPCAGNEPEKYYPSGTRTYVRVAPSDPNQAAVVAKFAEGKGVKSVYILNDKEAYGLGVAKNFQGAAKALGMEIKGFAAYDPKQPNFQATFTKIKATDPDAIFVGGLIDENSGQLINDKVSILGPNVDSPSKGTMLLLPDGFTDNAIFDRAEGGTPNAKGAYYSVAGVGIDQYKGAALEWIDGFQQSTNAESISPYSILAAQSAQVLLDAIENSDGSRSEVIKNVFDTKVDDGLIGSFSFNENGDLSGATGAATLFTIYIGTNELVTEVTTSPEADLVEAARKEAAG
jgi:branched-chain amino acid transport system substrate-binding protein